MDVTTTTPSASDSVAIPATNDFQMGVWQPSLFLLGGIGTAMWAFKTKRKGKGWWIIGGAFVGSIVGYMIDKA